MLLAVVCGALATWCGVMRLTAVPVVCSLKPENRGLYGSCGCTPAIDVVEQQARCSCCGVTAGDLRLGTSVLRCPTLHKRRLA